MNVDRSSTLYATVLLTITGLVGQILGFFYRIALSRLIGAETMGLYQLIMPVYSVLLSIASIGLTTTVTWMTFYPMYAAGMSVTSCISIALGAKDTEKAKKAAENKD